jgi:transposase
MSSQKMTASQMLSEYRSRNGIEEGFRDIKHGIDIRPLRCRDDSSVKGRVLIAFLAYFVIQLAKVLEPGLKGRTGDTFVQKLTSFSVTLIREGGEIKDRIHSNFNDVMKPIFEEVPRLLSFFPYGSRLGKTMKPAERSK